MLPEYLLATMAAALMGWGGFTWKKAEEALTQARQTSDQIDKLELKVAEHYLTKADFELSMNRLFKTLERFEEKLDFHVFNQEERIAELRGRLKEKDNDD